MQLTTVFLCYSRRDLAVVRDIASDLEKLKYTVWFDQDLSGGQLWWQQILDHIRECHYFLFVLSQSSLDSHACKRELSYAAALNRPILPLLVGDDISFHLLPPNLSEVQHVDYRKRSDDPAEAIFKLNASLQDLPAESPLPSPLPRPPEVPISYLGGFSQKLSTECTMSREEQCCLLLDLKGGLRNPLIREEAQVLLNRMRMRPDLLATLAQEIDEILSAVQEVRHELPGILQAADAYSRQDPSAAWSARPPMGKVGPESLADSPANTLLQGHSAEDIPINWKRRSWNFSPLGGALQLTFCGLSGLSFFGDNALVILEVIISLTFLLGGILDLYEYINSGYSLPRRCTLLRPAIAGSMFLFGIGLILGFSFPYAYDSPNIITFIMISDGIATLVVSLRLPRVPGWQRGGTYGLLAIGFGLATIFIMQGMPANYFTVLYARTNEYLALGGLFRVLYGGRFVPPAKTSPQALSPTS